MANFSNFFLSNASPWNWRLVYSHIMCKYLLQNSTILWNFLQFSHIASKFNDTKGYPLYVGLLWLAVFVKSRLHPFKFLSVETLRLSWNIFIYHECLRQTTTKKGWGSNLFVIMVLQSTNLAILYIFPHQLKNKKNSLIRLIWQSLFINFLHTIPEYWNGWITRSVKFLQAIIRSSSWTGPNEWISPRYKYFFILSKFKMLPWLDKLLSIFLPMTWMCVHSH